MSRAKKVRKVCRCLLDGAVGHSLSNASGVGLSVDEVESLRLADLEGFEQEECARRMGVSRGTFQRVLYTARKKSAYGILSGVGVRLSSGSDAAGVSAGACDGTPSCQYCRRRLSSSSAHRSLVKTLSLCCDSSDSVCDLRRCMFVHIVGLDSGRLVDERRVCVMSLSESERIDLLVSSGCEALLCVDLGGEHRMTLTGCGCCVITGVHGSVTSVVESYLSGELSVEV